MKISEFSDQQLTQSIRSDEFVSQEIVDEYYQRCIPIYLDFLGVNWHTGFYFNDHLPACPIDQERMTQFIASSASVNAKNRVLDVGCGIGGTCIQLAKHFDCKVYGLTPVREQIRVAQQLVSKQDFKPNIDFKIGHANALPFADNTLDVVLYFESPCHFPNTMDFFEEAYRVLKPGGRIAGEDWMAVNNISSHSRKNWLKPICNSWAIPMLHDGNDYIEQLQQSGFEQCQYVDMADEMFLNKGFAVSSKQQIALLTEIRTCDNALLKLTLEGILNLGRAIENNAFTIGRVLACKPL